MQKEKDYRPVHIEFDVATDNSLMPENFGTFETLEEAAKFMGGNMVVINQAMTVNRHMDHVEKKLLRDQCTDLLENILPVNERNHSLATNELAEAKKKEKEAGEMVSATINEAKMVAAEVKRGLKEMGLDDIATFKVPFKGRFYCYTFIDKAVRLVKIQDIPEYQKGELFTQSASNEAFIDTNFGTGEVKKEEPKNETQKGKSSGKASAKKGKEK